MVREIGKKIKRFSLEDSDALEENERILAMGSQLKKRMIRRVRQSLSLSLFHLQKRLL